MRWELRLSLFLVMKLNRGNFWYSGHRLHTELTILCLYTSVPWSNQWPYLINQLDSWWYICMRLKGHPNIKYLPVFMILLINSDLRFVPFFDLWSMVVWIFIICLSEKATDILTQNYNFAAVKEPITGYYTCTSMIFPWFWIHSTVYLIYLFTLQAIAASRSWSLDPSSDVVDL